MSARTGKKDTDDGAEKSMRKGEKKRFSFLPTDWLSRKSEQDESKDTVDEKRARPKRKKKDDKPSASKTVWWRRVFSDKKTDLDTSKEKTTKEQRNSSSEAINKLSRNLASIRYNKSPARTAKQKEIIEKNQSPPSFNPLLYVQTAWKNTAATFFDADSKLQNDEWVTVFQTSGIMPGESVPITMKGIDLLVVASLDGRSLYCIENSCPHLGTPLETGQLTRLPMEESSVTPSASTTASSTTNDDTTTTDIFGSPQDQAGLILSETQVSEILSQDGCEDCIVCPLHRTAFALRSGAVRGEWCPHPPILGPAMGTIKKPTAAKTYEIRTRGKNVQVKLAKATAAATNVP